MHQRHFLTPETAQLGKERSRAVPNFKDFRCQTFLAQQWRREEGDVDYRGSNNDSPQVQEFNSYFIFCTCTTTSLLSLGSKNGGGVGGGGEVQP